MIQTRNIENKKGFTKNPKTIEIGVNTKNEKIMYAILCCAKILGLWALPENLISRSISTLIFPRSVAIILFFKIGLIVCKTLLLELNLNLAGSIFLLQIFDIENFKKIKSS
jgi:hypothetical protein